MQKFNIFKTKLQKILQSIKFFKIDFSFLLLLVFAIIIEEIKLYFIFVLFLVLHELTHFIVAKKLGYMSGKIRLSFFGASLEGLDDFSLSDEIKIVLAGPLFNLSIIILCYLSFWFYPESYEYLCDVQLVNFAILIFNMLPIFPLDNGRIILAFLSLKHKRNEALIITKRISLFFILIMFILFIVSCFFSFNFMLGLVSVNLAFLTLSKSKDTAYKRELFMAHKFSLIKKGLIERTIYVKSDTDYFKLFKYIDDYHFITFKFVDKNMNVQKTITELELYRQFY